MPRKGKQLGEKERQRLAVIPELYSIYSTYLSEQVIDMIAKQCNYEMDECIAMLASMVADGAGSTSQSNTTSKSANKATPTAPSVAATSTKSSVASSSNVAASSSTSSNTGSSLSGWDDDVPVAAAPAPKKKGILFLATRTEADRTRKQPASVWKKQGDTSNEKESNSVTNGEKKNVAPNSNYNLSRSNTHSSSSRTSSAAAASNFEDESTFGEDANDSPLLQPIEYRYIGYESTPYFLLQPSLLASIPPRIDVPRIPPVILDDTSLSARDPTSVLNVIHAPSDSQHHLHSLYLQLRNSEPEAAPARASGMFTAAPSRLSPSTTSQQDLENLTPAQALAYQAQQKELEKQQKKQQQAWMKKHEQEKRKIRESSFAMSSVPDAASAEVPASASSSPPPDDVSQMTSQFDSSSLSLSREDSPPPSDLPAPLTREESRVSFQRFRQNPDELVAMLETLFDNIETDIIKAIVESILAPSDVEEGDRDIAQECCDTLLTMVEEKERADEERRAKEIQLNEQAVQQMTSGGGNKQNKKPQQNGNKKSSSTSNATVATPFVPSSHQLTDAELAYRMSIDPEFDINAYAPLDANVGLSATAIAQANSSSGGQGQQVKKNRRGHIVLPRGVTNVWQNANATPAFGGAAMSPSSTSSSLTSKPAPDLSSQWSLAALVKTFPTLERELIEMTFEGNEYRFDQTKEHLKELYPDSLRNDSIKPKPVAQPWSQSSVHHSKVNTVSRIDAEHGKTVANQDEIQNASGGDAAVGEEGFSDALLEAELGNVLDNLGGASSSSSSSDLRAEASHYSSRRAVYYTAAVNAFARGQAGVASDYVRRGRNAARELQSSNRRGCFDIFRQANVNQDCTQRIDLHGLHVQETLQLLPFLLRRHRTRHAAHSKELTLITGLGIHSQGGIKHAKLFPAVLEYLKRYNHTYTTRGEGELRVFFK